MQEAEIEARIRAFLTETNPERAETIAAMGTTENLWTVIDSMRLLELVDWIEQAFSVTVEPVEFVPDTFATLASLAQFIAQKSSVGAEGSRDRRAARAKRLKNSGHEVP